jgi:hypothetical protein
LLQSIAKVRRIVAKTTVLEIPAEEVPKFEAQLAQLLAKMQQAEAEHAAREVLLAPLRADTDQVLAAISRSIANVEKYLAATGVPFHRQ